MKKNKNLKPQNDNFKKIDLSKQKGLKKIPAFFVNLTKGMINDMKKFKKKFSKGNMGEKLLTIFMLGLITITTIIVVFFLFVIIGAPSFSEDKLYSKESSIIYDINGEEYSRLGTENRQIVSYDDLPEVFIDALIATEDSRFMQHNGVDMARFLKASLGQLFGNSDAGGASTLTMQIVKQKLTDDTATGIKGIIRKFTDVYMAVFKIEKKYTKEQIIEFYVNIPYLGSGAYGIEQASQIYFNKSISDVTLTEAALIAGLFQAPGAYDPYSHPEKAESRRNQVLTLMKRHGYITDEECAIAKSVSVKSLLANDGSAINENQGMIDTIVEEVKRRTKEDTGTELDPYLVSMKIYSTVNPEKQEVINKINVGTNLGNYKWPNDVIQTGIAVIDVKTGAISAVGAGRNKKGELSYNYATMINRHPGSTAKPLFDYGPAIEYLNWGTGQMIIDDNHTYSNGLAMKNWDSGYKGIMTIKTALAASRNIPALYTYQSLSQKNIKDFVTGLGLKPEYDSTGFINESHSIGGYTGTNPVELAAAYATFARGGIYIEPHSFTKIEFEKTGEIYVVTPEKRTVMKDSTAYMINTILRFAVTNGDISAGSKSGTDVASKTGTSTVDEAIKKELGIKASIIGDSWQLVYSPDYVCSTWVGYPKITKDYYLTSAVGSNARKAVSKALTAGILETNSRFKQPSSVVSANIELETNPVQLASDFTPSNLKSTEYFKKGTAPSEVSTRFSKLENPTNLKATYDNGVTTLDWSSIPTPDAISNEYLTEYFNEGYTKWANKYLTNRINYNNNYIGSIGYNIYINNNGVLTDLGWTSSSTFNYNGYLTNKTTFVVKSSYSIFKSNMSDGISAVVTPSDTSNVTTPSNNWSIELQGDSCMISDKFLGMLTMNLSFVTVKDSGVDVTKNAIVTNTCKDNLGTEISCQSLSPGNQYTIIHNVKYNNQLKSVERKIKPAC